MLYKRLGHFLISGVFAACAVVILALADRIAKENEASRSG